MGKFKLGGVGASAVYDDRDGLVKIVADTKYGEILGAHIVGNRACDMIAELVDTIEPRGRLPGARPDHPPAPDDLRGRARRRPRRGRLGDPRLAWATTFYYDLGSPYSYLAAERISFLFADEGLDQPEWQPILLGGLFARFDRGSWSLTDAREEGMREVERRADALGIQPIRWPDPWPGNTLHAMRVATYAKSIGRSVSFAQRRFARRSPGDAT